MRTDHGGICILNEQKTEQEMEIDNRKKTRVVQISRRQKWLCTDHIVQKNRVPVKDNIGLGNWSMMIL